MAKKYNAADEKNILDTTKTFEDKFVQDIRDVWRKEIGFIIKEYAIEEHYYHDEENFICPVSMIGPQALTQFGVQILKDSLSNNVNYYQLLIPSTTIAGTSHAVAFMIDHKRHIIRYHDSRGTDMRREIKDFLKKLLPDFDIRINYSKQQKDAVSNITQTENDNSCAVLSLYNLRDMWNEQNGRPEQICNFDSTAARQDAWNILKQIEHQPEPNQTLQNTRKPLLVVILTEPISEAAEKAFKYRLYEDPNYDTLLNQAVKDAYESYNKYRFQTMGQIMSGRNNMT